MQPDFVLRGGTIVDGTGREPVVGDVAIKGDHIVAVGKVSARGVQEFDAHGLLVTPGFVDIHTHYDGNLTWEDRIQPSGAHGVTTIVTGNCGVGFAPCKPSDRDGLIRLMAGVEDIPEAVMADGLPWTWSTFPEFLDVVEARPHDMNVAVQIPHSPLRVYVMGQRAVDREPATADDIAQMAALVREGMNAGAIGFATSRALQQRSLDGESIPSVRAGEDELLGIAMALGKSGGGVLQLLSDFDSWNGVEKEFAMFRRLVGASGRPLSYTLHQRHNDPEGWRRLLEMTEAAKASGLTIRAQVAPRPTGVLLGFELSMSPFMQCPTFASLSGLPFDRRVAALQDSQVRSRILEEFEAGPKAPTEMSARIVRDFGQMFLLGDPPDHEPTAEDSLQARAARLGIAPSALAYDLMLQNGGRALLMQTAQDYAYGTAETTREMLVSDSTVMGLGDGGAHCGILCDASWPTHMLAHWVRDRSRGATLPLPFIVKKMTSDCASAVGLLDRGVVAPGYKADLNLIDFERLRLRMPHVVYDLPTGGRRVVQNAEGYVATFVNGQVVSRDNGKPTGVLSGKLVRGPQPAPATMQ